MSLPRPTRRSPSLLLLCALFSGGALASGEATAPAVVDKAAGQRQGKDTIVRVTARMAAAAAVGQPAGLTLEFDRAPGSGATATLESREGLVVTRADGSAVGVLALSADGPTRVELQVTAPREGRLHFDVIVRRAGRVAVRSIPVQVGLGGAPTKPAGRAQTTPSGEKVISMPAR